LALTSSPSPRAGGEKVPSVSEADEGLPRATTNGVAVETPRSPSSALRAPSPRLRGEEGGRVAAVGIPATPVGGGSTLLDGTADDCRRAGLAVTTPQLLAGAYRAKLRNRVPPYALSTRTAAPREIERVMYDATYKGITDIVTKYVWPTPAFIVTRW